MTEWNEATLKSLISTGAEESLQLEFKRADALSNTDAKPEIGKDVSSFANSAGGTILYGIEEIDHKAKAFSPIDASTHTKEWLEQVINSRIQPRISGIVIHLISLSGNNAGLVVYAVAIPEGDTAYQASDKRYYKRFNFQAVPMEDYEIRQTMNRQKRAAYAAWLKSHRQQTGGPNQYSLRMQAMCLNTSETVGHEFACYAYIPSHVFGLDLQPWQSVEIDGEQYYRVHGTTGLTLHPGNPTMVNFSQGFDYDPTQLHAKIPVYLRLYDSNGLALSQAYILSMPDCQVEDSQTQVLYSAALPAAFRP